MKSNEQDRKTALNFYESIKSELGEGEKIGHGLVKKVFKEDGWTYTFFIDNENLLKVEGENHRELIEVWM